MNNPNFPGERRLVEEGKIDNSALLARLPKTATGTSAVPLNVAAGQPYQVTKPLTRHIAPAPGTQVLGNLTKPLAGHQIAALSAMHKKDKLTMEVQKVPLSLTSTTVASVPPGNAGSNIIPVHVITSASTLHVPTVSSMVRGVVPQTLAPTANFSHIPRGLSASAHVRTGSTGGIQRQTLPSTMQLPGQAGSLPLNLHGPIRTVLPQMMRPGTPPSNRSNSPVISISNMQSTEAHRASISLQSISTANTAANIQITLPHSRTVAETGIKPVTTFQPTKVHVNPTSNLTAAQPKVVMSQAISPSLHHAAIPAKANRGVVSSSVPMSTVTVTLSTTTVTIPLISTGTTSASIPIAKVPPQRQHHPIPSTLIAVDVRTSETSTYLPSHASHPSQISSQTPSASLAHVGPAANTAAQNQTLVHSQPSHSQALSSSLPVSQSTTNLFIPQPQRVATTVTTTTVGGSASTVMDNRETIPMPTMPFFPPYMLQADNPFYQQLMRYQVAAQAQSRPGLITQPAASLAGSLHTPITTSNVRFNQGVVVMADTLRQGISQPVTTPSFHSASSEATASKVLAASECAVPGLSQPVTTAMSVAAVAAAASSLYTATTQTPHGPQIGQAAPNTPSSTPVNNPSASPRPSILRKRTNEGLSTVKKQLALTSTPDIVNSPRPEARPDSTPQSNMSSPKTPASGESQSSTDTALSSEATTPTQPHTDKVKQEPPDPQENGYPNTPEASPRKRRKQLLQATEELHDPPMNVLDKLVEACVKEEDGFTDDFDDDDDDFLTEDDEKHELKKEYIDDEGIRWTVEKTHSGYSLLNFYNISWKPKNNHFIRYIDVKAKDERRPTVNELSNQKGVMQKASGWKLYHMAAQIEDLVELERDLNTKLQDLQVVVGATPPLHHSLMEDESGMLHELTQGNIQRCKLITDQLSEAKSSMLKVLDHKHKISEIISKHMSKRPIKKKERT